MATATEQAWLDVPPRRRLAIPSRDLAVGVAMGVALCGLVLALAAGMETTPAPVREEPLTVSIGVLAASEAPSGGGSGRAGKASKRRSGKKGAAPSHEPSAMSTEPMPSPSAPSTRTLPRSLDVPSPWSGELPGLPGLGDLGDPHDGVAEGGDGEGGDGTGEGDGSGTGNGSGTGDGGLGAYRSQLAAWLGAHFHVEGSGLGAKALRGLRVRAVLELDEARVVVGYELRPTGTPAVDAAARRALEAVKGQPVPAPPPTLGALQRRIHVVLTCRPDTCS